MFGFVGEASGVAVGGGIFGGWLSRWGWFRQYVCWEEEEEGGVGFVRGGELEGKLEERVGITNGW